MLPVSFQPLKILKKIKLVVTAISCDDPWL